MTQNRHQLADKLDDAKNGLTSCDASPFSLEGAVAHAARGRDGRQEGRECGYYNLHRYLNNALLHNF